MRARKGLEKGSRESPPSLVDREKGKAKIQPTSSISVTGTLWQAMKVHHRGDALFCQNSQEFGRGAAAACSVRSSYI